MATISIEINAKGTTQELNLVLSEIRRKMIFHKDNASPCWQDSEHKDKDGYAIAKFKIQEV